MDKKFLVYKKAIIAFLMCSSITFTNTSHATLTTRNIRPLITISNGISNAIHVTQSAQFYTATNNDNEFFDYTAHHGMQTSMVACGFIGLEWQNNTDWLYQFGLAYKQAAPFAPDGTFVQGVDDGSSNIYTYHYSVLTRQLLLEGKLLFFAKKYYHPYLLTGIGAAFNKAYNYYTNAPTVLTFTRIYKDNNTTSFAYILGVGLDIDLTSSLRFGIGYQFTDDGKVTLGQATIDTNTVPGTLSQSHFYTHELTAQLTWFFA